MKCQPRLPGVLFPFLLTITITLNMGLSQTAFWKAGHGPAVEMVISLAVDQQGIYYAGKGGGGIDASQDFGNTWTPVTFPYSGDHDGVNAILSLDNTLYAGVAHTIWGEDLLGDIVSSDNGGTTWKSIAPSKRICLDLINDLEKNIYAVCGYQAEHPGLADSLPGIFLSTDVGISWTNITPNSNLPYEMQYYFTVAQQTGNIYLASYGSSSSRGSIYSLLCSTDNGNSWDSLSLPPMPSAPIKLFVSVFNTIYFQNGNGIMYRSTDDGIEWLSVNGNTPGSAVNTFIETQEGVTYAGTQDSGAYRSSDDGINWEQINSGLSTLRINALAIDSLGYLLAATTYGGVVRSAEPVTNIYHDISVTDPWNLISLPYRVENNKKNVLFPDAVSECFSYQHKYVSQDSMANGAGYWLKFEMEHTASLRGSPILRDTIHLVQGWNLIGSIAVPVPRGKITSPDPALSLSDLFGYADSGYAVETIIQPAHGYWVKANKEADIILDTASAAMAGRSRPLFLAARDAPPPAPGDRSPEMSPALLPAEFRLDQNYPNPFNPSTIIRYQLPVASHVMLKVCNILGQEVAELVNGMQEAGFRTVKFENANLPGGVYLYRLSAGIFSEVKKMVILR